MRNFIRNILCGLIMVLCITAPQQIFATEDTEREPLHKPVIVNTDYSNAPSLSKTKKTTKISWEASEYQGVKISYEIQRSTSSKFTKSKTKSFYTSKKYKNFERVGFGTNGGNFYFRVRIWANRGTDDAYCSEWSDTRKLAFVKLNKTNFPGLYNVLKKGCVKHHFEDDGSITSTKVFYDANSDGWLDPNEIKEILILEPFDSKVKVSSTKGIKYFQQMSILKLYYFTGKTIDATLNPNLKDIWVSGICSSSIKIKGEQIKQLHVESHWDNKLKTVDISSCKDAVEVNVQGGSGSKMTTTLKLPTYKKNLMSLSLSSIGKTTIDLNSYTNLREVYFYKMDKMTSVKVNKCKKLQYIYFYFCDKISKVDLKSNKKLVGAGVHSCKKLKKSGVKMPSNGTLKMQKGKWWYGTKKYNKMWEEIWDAIYDRD